MYYVHGNGRNRKPKDDGHSLSSGKQIFLHIPEIHVAFTGLWYVVKGHSFLSILFYLPSLFCFVCRIVIASYSYSFPFCPLPC